MELGEREFGSFVDGVPPPLAIDAVRLDGDAEVAGFVCEPHALDGAPDILEHRGRRGFQAAGA